MLAVLKIRGLPVPQGSMTCVGGGPRAGARIHNVQPSNKAELKPWRTKIAAAAKRVVDEYGFVFIAQDPVLVEITFTMERPKSVDRDWPSVAPDIDKLCRAVLDGLTAGEIWADDGQCVELRAVKAYPGWTAVPHPEDVLDTPGVTIRLSDAPNNRLI